MKNKNTLIAIGLVLVIGGLFYSSTFIRNQKIKALEESRNLVSTTDIHWHPHLSITIKGEPIEIPANLGIGMQYAGYPRFDSMMGMTDMHTHDNSGTLHWEAMVMRNGAVTKEDIKLGSFFKIWGKTFSKDCIFNSCNGQDGTVKMFVNGEENAKFENYLINDKDKIEIRYE